MNRCRASAPWPRSPHSAGSGNFCMLTDTPMDDIVTHLRREGIDVVDGPDQRAGATRPILSVSFRDPDGNLVEVSSPYSHRRLQDARGAQYQETGLRRPADLAAGAQRTVGRRQRSGFAGSYNERPIKAPSGLPSNAGQPTGALSF
jgi:hypothetical protein